MTKSMSTSCGYLSALLGLFGIKIWEIPKIAHISIGQGVGCLVIVLMVWMFNAVRQGFEFFTSNQTITLSNLAFTFLISLFTLAGDLPTLGPINPDIKNITVSAVFALTIGMVDNYYHYLMTRERWSSKAESPGPSPSIQPLSTQPMNLSTSLQPVLPASSA